MTVLDDLDVGCVSPWEIGRAQEAVVELLELDLFHGRVLDVACGTGDNALFLAAHGVEVVGIDSSSSAIERAKEKAIAQLRAPRLFIADALRLSRLNNTFDTVLDCGFLHTLTDDGRAVYLRSLGAVMTPGSFLHVLCLADSEAFDWGGPRRFSATELAELGTGFFLEDIAPARYENLVTELGTAAWRATYTFGGPGPRALQ